MYRKSSGIKMRIQFELTDEKAKELDALKLKMGVSTNKDLFENALCFMEWGINEIDNNPDRVIGSIDEEKDSYKVLQMPVFSNIRSRAKARIIQAETA
jgi:hypothetical protein